MRRRMSVAQTQYFMDRLRIFWSMPRCAEEFEASILTIDRWCKGRTTPPYGRLGDFEDALERLCKQLVRKANGPNRQHFAHIAEALVQEACPEWTAPPGGVRDTKFLREVLLELLTGERSVNSNDIFKETDELGYSRAQVYNIAHRLGVKMQQVKLGRGGHSLWTLSKRRARRG